MVAGVRGLVLALASTKSAPHRSGDPARLRRHEGLGVASTKSAPHRSGDPAVASSTSVRSAAPQRSPLPTGAETPVHGWARRSRLAGLNEVRSPQERRPARTRRACPMTGCSLNEVRSPQERRLPGREEGGHGADAASTKSAPHRSGDVRQIAYMVPPRSLNEVRSPQERRQHLRLQPFDMGRRDLRRALGSRGIREAPCLSASAHKPWADKPFSDATARRIPDIDGALAKVPGSLQMMMGPSTVISRDRPRKLNCSAPSVAVRPRSQTSTLSSPGSSTASRAACRETNWAGKASTTKTEYWTRSPNPSRTRAARDLRRSSGMS